MYMYIFIHNAYPKKKMKYLIKNIYSKFTNYSTIKMFVQHMWM